MTSILPPGLTMNGLEDVSSAVDALSSVSETMYLRSAPLACIATPPVSTSSHAVRELIVPSVLILRPLAINSSGVPTVSCGSLSSDAQAASSAAGSMPPSMA